MSDLSHHTEISFFGTFICSAFAACFAEICTIPLDTAKVRLQLQKRAALGDDVGASKYKGLLGTVATIAKEEGLLALWKGIIPGLHRQFIYGGLRISLYEPVKAFCAGGIVLADISLFQKIVAALITGIPNYIKIIMKVKVCYGTKPTFYIMTLCEYLGIMLLKTICASLKIKRQHLNAAC